MNVISAFIETFRKVVNGETSTRINTTEYRNELKEVGENVNTIIANFASNITELANTKKYYEDIIDNLPIGVVVYRVDDPDKKWMKINPVLEKIVGYSASDILGKRTELQAFNTDEATRIIEQERKKIC